MKLDVKIQLLKFCSHVFNTILVLVGVSVVGCAVWILFDRGGLQAALPSEELHIVGAGLLFIGGAVVLVGVLGCVGADTEYRLLLVVYLGLLLVLVLGQLFVSLLLLLSRDKIGRSLNQTVDTIIADYGRGGADGIMDDIQTAGRCCGRMGPVDWLKNSYIQSLNLTDPDVLPCSCFTSFNRSEHSPWCSESPHVTEPPHGLGNTSYKDGCGKALDDWWWENGLTIACMDVALILMQALQFGIMIKLYRAIGKKAALKRTPPLSDPGPAHLDEEEYAEQNYGYVDDDDGYADPAHPAYHHGDQYHMDPSKLSYHHDNQNYGP